MPLAEPDLIALYQRHVAMVYRICFAHMKSPSPTEDAVQETFIKAMTRAPRFETAEHEKAWLIRVATNVCKDQLKTWWGKKVSLDPDTDTDLATSPDSTLAVVLSLPDKYKSVVYLHYYEGYATEEIATILARPASTVRNHLSEARQLLRKRLGDFDE